MSWMMVVAIGWLFWLYDYIRGGRRGVVGDHFHRLLRPVVRDGVARVCRRRPGDQPVHPTGFGTIFSHIYAAIEASHHLDGERLARPAMATCCDDAAERSVLYFQHQLKVGDMTPGCRAPVPGASVQCRLQQGERRFVLPASWWSSRRAKKRSDQDAKWTLNDSIYFQRYMEPDRRRRPRSRRRHLSSN